MEGSKVIIKSQLMPREKEEKVEGLGKDQEASILGEGNWKVFMTELYHVLSDCF